MDSGALKLFVRAHELGSISAAARELGWLPATASAALFRAEKELNGKLFTRTTRSLKATPNGERFLEHARQALATLEEGRELFHSDKQNVQGLVRLSAPTDIGEQLVQPGLDAFLERYSGVSLTLQLTDQVRDIGREDVDAAIRYGTIADGNLIVRKLADTRRVLVASPTYLERRGVPTRPEDLASHECVLLKLGTRHPDRWRLLRDRSAIEIKVHGRRLSDNGATTRRWAVAGHGIALKAWLDVGEDVAQGRLVRVLPGYASESYPLTLAMSSGVRLAGRMRALGEWLLEQFRARMRQYPFPGVVGRS
jgi:DNA-binding transcriptional LysR family regulator